MCISTIQQEQWSRLCKKVTTALIFCFLFVLRKPFQLHSVNIITDAFKDPLIFNYLIFTISLLNRFFFETPIYTRETSFKAYFLKVDLFLSCSAETEESAVQMPLQVQLCGWSQKWEVLSWLHFDHYRLQNMNVIK